MKQKAIIVGGGAGGITLAAYLARSGMDVTVIEKNETIGGRCSTIYEMDPTSDPSSPSHFRHDLGPSLLLMKPIFDRVFEELGEKMEDHVRLVRCDPNYIVHFIRSATEMVTAGNGKMATRSSKTRAATLSNPSPQTPDRIMLSSDVAVMRSELNKFHQNAFDGYLRFLSEARRHYDLSIDNVLMKNFDSWWQLATSPVQWMSLARDFDIAGTVWGSTGKYFETDELRQAFSFQTMYMGMSPYDAPATYNLLQFTEFAEGIWYPMGGFNEVLVALQRIAMKYGARFVCSTTVTEICVNEFSRTTGVRVCPTQTPMETRFTGADVVICNADLVHAYNHLLPNPTAMMNRSMMRQKSPMLKPNIMAQPSMGMIPKPAPNSGGIVGAVSGAIMPYVDRAVPANWRAWLTYPERLRQMEHTCSTFSFYWGLSRKIPELGAHSVFLCSDAYRASFDQIFKDGTLPDMPSFYIHTASRVDPTAAPAGKDCLTVLVPTGHMNDAEDYCDDPDGRLAKLQARARAMVISVLEERLGIPDFEALIQTERVMNPVKWQQSFNLSRGSILGLGHNVTQVLWMRPRTRHDVIDNMFFVGSSTHPGVGVPIVLCSARVVAEQILGGQKCFEMMPTKNTGIVGGMMGTASSLLNYATSAVFGNAGSTARTA
ncbi:phytoene desaturase [Cladochytrium replicatum]|nr:phytoene desaturase [Cladochytrium replicatum]